MSDQRKEPGWLKERNALRAKACLNDPYALSFLETLMNAVEVWDDLIDKDKSVTDSSLNEVFVDLLFWLPQNPFFNAHKAQLLPVIMTCINAWMDSNVLQHANSLRDRQAAWWLKQMGVELYGTVALLTGGFNHMRDVSLQARHVLAHEDFIDYEQENNHA